MAYEYAQWSAVGEQFKFDDIQQLAKLDVEHEYFDEHVYAAQQPEDAFNIDASCSSVTS